MLPRNCQYASTVRYYQNYLTHLVFFATCSNEAIKSSYQVKNRNGYPPQPTGSSALLRSVFCIILALTLCEGNDGEEQKKSAHMQTSNITHIKIKFDLITFKGFMCAVRGVARNRNQKIMKTILRVRKREEVNSYNSDALKCLMKFNIILNRCIVKRSIISLHVYINLPHNDNNRHTRMF